MPDAEEHPIRPSALADAGRPLGSRIAEMAERLADLVSRVTPGPLVRSGAMRLTADGPAPERSLVTAEGLWALLRGADVWPASVEPLVRTVLPGIADTWLQAKDAEQARKLLAANARVTLLVLA